jgi:hypothetical protein
VALMTTARERPHGMKVIDLRVFVLGAHSWKGRPMRVVIGRVKIKPDRADEATCHDQRDGCCDAARHDRLGRRLLVTEPRR